MSIELLILFSLTVAATFFVLVVSVGLVVHKAIHVRRQVRRKKLYREYASLFAEKLLEPLPPLPPAAKTSAVFEQYENLILPLKQRLAELSRKEREEHRSIMRIVLIDFAQDLRGDATDRLVYFFYSFKFVEDHIKLMESPHWWIRAQVARDMGLVRARKSITALTAALEDPHPDVRNQAMRSLVAIVGAEALRTILRISRNMTRWSQIELSILVVQFRKDALPYLLEGLDSPDKTVVSFCVEMLGEIGFVMAVEPLLQLARTNLDVDLRVRIVESLGRIGDQRSEPLLREFARNPYLPLRLKAIDALGRLGSPESIPLLVELFQSGDLEQKLTAGRAILKCGAVGKEVLESFRLVGNQAVDQILDEVLEQAQWA
jgi:hypothetical protein